MSKKTISYCDFGSDEAKVTDQLIEFYQGEQLEYLIDQLSGKKKFGERLDWTKRGYVPTVRNIIKPIVEKSGLLFNKPPQMELWVNGKPLPESNQTLDDLMRSIDWTEFFQNVDTFTRLLKTVVVLWCQYIPDNITTTDGIYKFNMQRGDALLPILLHRGNCVVKTDFTGRIITEMAYLTTEDMDLDETIEEDTWTYRVITPTTIEDWKVTNSYSGVSLEEMYDSQPNPYGFIPAIAFHDTQRPLNSFWNDPPEDLCNLQSTYNLHLTDTNFAMAWQKQKTLFVNAPIVESDEQQTIVPTAPYGHTDPGAIYDQLPYFSQQQGQANNIGGLGKVVRLSNDDQGNAPLVEFKGPDTDLKALSDILEGMVENVAQDWSVTLKQKTAGSGRAQSGFQLIVEEIDNLNLREKRSQFFQSAFRRSYEMLQALYPELPRGELVLKFAPPSLPVNIKEQEDVWTQKITQGRASVVDYFMEVDNLSQDEAIKKAEEVKQFNNMFSTSAINIFTAPNVQGAQTTSNESGVAQP